MGQDLTHVVGALMHVPVGEAERLEAGLGDDPVLALEVSLQRIGAAMSEHRIALGPAADVRPRMVEVVGVPLAPDPELADRMHESAPADDGFEVLFERRRQRTLVEVAQCSARGPNPRTAAIGELGEPNRDLRDVEDASLHSIGNRANRLADGQIAGGIDEGPCRSGQRQASKNGDVGRDQVGRLDPALLAWRALDSSRDHYLDPGR